MVDGPVDGELLCARLSVPTVMLVFGPGGIELRSNWSRDWRVVVPMTPATIVGTAPKFLLMPAGELMIWVSKTVSAFPPRLIVTHACADTTAWVACPSAGSSWPWPPLSTGAWLQPVKIDNPGAAIAPSRR